MKGNTGKVIKLDGLYATRFRSIILSNNPME